MMVARTKWPPVLSARPSQALKELKGSLEKSGDQTSFEGHAAVFEKRDYFGFAPEKAVSTKQNSPTEDSRAREREISRDFKIVGIVIDHDPRLIVEDTKKKSTLFLSRGESLGQAVLKDIKQGRAIFFCEGHNFELAP